MANALYPSWKQALLEFTAGNDLDGQTVKAALVTAGYTYSAAHQFYNSASASVVGTPQTIGSKTFTNGVFDGANVTFTAVTGSQVVAIVLYIDSGNPATSPLVAFLDTGITNLPVTPNGGDISITWDATGIFSL
ncbi:MAG: hypothetical protein RLZZ387_2636 [Chloroflexota bacterium]|jgi:hypothetical protein